MKKNGIIAGLIAVFAAIVFGGSQAAFGQSLILNEVEFDAPNEANESCQYVELRGTPGATVPAGVQFVSVNGDSGSFGDIQQPVSLGGQVVGANGTITIINDVELCAGRTFPAGTTQVFTTTFQGLGLGAESYLLISSPNTFSEGDDIDDNNDRIIDPADQVTVIDGIGFTINIDFQATYAPNLYNAATQGGGSIELPDAATRFSNNTTPLSAAAWYFGELASSPDNTIAYSGIPQSSNFPAGGVLTPGGANLPTIAAPRNAVVDFNGDGRTDFSVIRTENGQLIWYNALSGSGAFDFRSWGAPGDRPVSADFDDDDKDDVAVWRTNGADSAALYIINSSDNTISAAPFGQTGDDPSVMGDWDGDGNADPAVFRESVDGNYGGIIYRGSQTGDTIYISWGGIGDRPLVGDFDGDERLDAAVYRGSDNFCYIWQSSDGTQVFERFGLPSDTFVTGDFDNDGKSDLANYRGGDWIIRQSTDGQYRFKSWGLPTDVPVAGDYDGDGATDFAVFRDGVFYVTTSGGSNIFFSWGFGSDLPTASVFNN